MIQANVYGDEAVVHCARVRLSLVSAVHERRRYRDSISASVWARR